MAPPTLHRRALLHAYGYKHRQPQTATPRQPRRTAKKTRKKQTLTLKEKQLAARRRLENKKRVQAAIDEALLAVWHEAEKLHELLGILTPKKFYEMLLQRGGKTSRKPNRWNVWLHKRRNDKLAELNADEPHPKLMELTQEIKAEWASMSVEDRIDATDALIEEMNDEREQRQYTPHNSAIGGFHDTRVTIGKVWTEVERWHNRTSEHFIGISCRSEFDQYSRPQTFVTSAEIETFFQSRFKISVETLAKQLECHLLSGFEDMLGTKNSYYRELLEVKSQLAALLLEKIREAAAPVPIGKINYKNFNKITEKYGIVCDGWPLERFCCPGDINSMPELNVLRNAFKTDAARFRKLSNAELIEWRKARLAAAAPQAPAPTPALNIAIDIDIENRGPASLTDDTPAAAAATEVPVVPAAAAAPVAPFQQAVFNVNGGAVTQARPRKQRSDKGKKRGPNRRTGTLEQAAAA
ncbi:hypothetical protein PHLGIDRAFT_17194 [Phlebiopsis gigantea 11061_1 CR5-6]|uniref:Uncharacterized protein n=1 Tax=Phlebiopsis gigantea (strain 11061_1 CR5-6) TaxID=745531 RepID=A0A0C3RPJ4_PHLG1|nr:hypothetical protein PHLGIDRAFT_17194 [Phlebiopsis gigantea 11061_1 CR5-6]